MIDFRANPQRDYWSWLRASWNFGLFAPWVAWMRYQAMLDDLEAWRRRNWPDGVGAYWIK